LRLGQFLMPICCCLKCCFLFQKHNIVKDWLWVLKG